MQGKASIASEALSIELVVPMNKRLLKYWHVANEHALSSPGVGHQSDIKFIAMMKTVVHFKLSKQATSFSLDRGNWK